MTRIKVECYSDLQVFTDYFSEVLVMSVEGRVIEMDTGEARALVKALKKHIKKVEGA